MKAFKILYIFLFLGILLSACEDPIEMDVNGGKPALVVEGWLTNVKHKHYVNLSATKPLKSTGSFDPVTGAIITLSDGTGKTEVLKEVSPGKYEIATTVGKEGKTYTLKIQSSVGNYEAVAPMPRLSMPIDSIAFRYQEKSLVYEDPGYYPHFWGKETPGEGDYMQIKLYKNGKYLNRAQDINLFSDEFVDGNKITDAELTVDSPFVKGDKARAEVWSLTEGSYNFWTDILTQLLNGSVFASPLTNVRTNVKKTTTNSMDVTGYFGASMISAVERKVE